MNVFSGFAPYLRGSSCTCYSMNIVEHWHWKSCETKVTFCLLAADEVAYR